MKKTSEYNRILNSGWSRALIFAGILFINLMMTVPPKTAKDKNYQKNHALKTSARIATNIVIVHGALADGSGYKKLYQILTKKGFHVTVVQIPLTSLQEDIDATLRILDRQDGPTILVGHSWGGTVITEAGMHSKVVALVYIAAFQPDKGENTGQWASSLPAAPENCILPPDDKGFIYADKSKFHAGFAADLSEEETDFMWASQVPVSGAAFGVPVKEAAWKTKPTYGIVPTEDKAINPDIERKMYKRSGTKITEIKGSHVIFMSQPSAVADVIINASEQK